MYKIIFSIDDMAIDNSDKYKIIIEDLQYYEFFIELDEEGLYHHLEYGISLDSVWKTGYYNYNGKNYREYWVHMLDELICTREFDEEQDNIYIDFQRIFEDQCVEICKKFERHVKTKIMEGVK